MSDTELMTKPKVKIAKPKMWNVVLHNDDYTPMDFVIGILMGIYNKSQAEATAIMIAVHKEGRGIAGTYTKEIADEKVNETFKTAAAYGHPLRVTNEPQD